MVAGLIGLPLLMIKKLLFLAFFLIPAISFASWKFNPYTGKLDYYMGGGSTDDPTFGNLTVNGWAHIEGNVGIGTTDPKGLLQVGTSLTPGLVVLENGKVGIGTTNPTQSLTITTTSGGQEILFDGTAAGNIYQSSTSSLFINSNTGKIFLGSGNGNMNVTIDRYGNVGIGMTNPLAKLHVVSGGYYDVGGVADNSRKTILSGFLVETHAESGKPVILPYVFNDLAFNNIKGGNVVFTPEPNSTAGDDYLFDGLLAYTGWVNPVDTIEMNITFWKPFTYTNNIGFSSPVSFKARDFSVSVHFVSNDTWLEIGNETGYSDGIWCGTRDGASGGIDGMKVLFSNFSSATIFRVNEVFLENFYSSMGDGYFVRKVGSHMFGNIETTGNVGIGKTDSSAPLDIRGRTVGTTAWAVRVQDSTPTDRLVVLDSGRVGIATTNPVSVLHVYGGATFEGTQGNNTATFVSTGNNNRPAFYLGPSTDIDEFRVINFGYWDMGVTANQDWNFITNNLPRMRIKAGGNVGIGTTNPLANLEVGGVAGASGLKISNPADSLYYGLFGLGVSNTQLVVQSPYGMFFNTTANAGAGFDGSMTFTTVSGGGHYKFMVGNVGIGTTNPASRLDVMKAAASDTGLNIKSAAATGLENLITLTSSAGAITAKWEDISYVNANTSRFFISGGAGDAFSRFAVTNSTYNGFWYYFDGAGSMYWSDGATASGQIKLMRTTNDGLMLQKVSTPDLTGSTFTVKAAASQTGDLQQWQDSSGNILATVSVAGNIGIGITLPTSTLQIIGTGTGTQYVLCRTANGQIGTCDAPGTCATCTPF